MNELEGWLIYICVYSLLFSVFMGVVAGCINLWSQVARRKKVNKQQIKDIALANGFKLKEQLGCEMDLNPYVYDFATALFKQETEQLKQRITELESYNVKLANESQEYQQRCAELEKQREAAYEAWQVKYQRLKDSMSLTDCYECGTRVHEVSPRSRCCMCEYGRAQFNERENEQLRKRQE